MRTLALLAIGSMVVGIACASRVEPVAVAPSTVDAAISSATLGNDCDGSSSEFAGDCAEAPSQDGGARGGCAGYCVQSNLQLALTNRGTAAATIAVVEAHLLDAATGVRLDDVDAKNAKIWTGSTYTPWGSSLGAGVNAKVTYDMTQIDWTKVGGGNSWNTYSRKYKLEIVLRVDGSDRTLVSGELSREPEVVT
jgi:hypothetical protein